MENIDLIITNETLEKAYWKWQIEKEKPTWHPKVVFDMPRIFIMSKNTPLIFRVLNFDY